MDIRVINATIAAVLTGLLGFYPYLRQRDKLTKLFAISNLSLALWNLGDVVVLIPESHIAKLLLFRLNYVAGVMVVWYFFLFTFAYMKIDISKIKKPWYMLLTVGGLLIVLSGTRLIVADIDDLVHPFKEIPGQAYPLFIAFLSVGLGFPLYKLFSEYRVSNKIDQLRLKYMFVALFFAFSEALIFFLTLYYKNLPPFYFYLQVVYVLIVSYAILTQRLMDIELLARDALTRFFSLTLMAVPLLIGGIFAQAVLVQHQSEVWRTLTTVGVSILSLSMSILFLRVYLDARARALSGFLFFLSLCLVGDIVLCIPEKFFSVFAYRGTYVIFCWLLVVWFKYWRSYFDDKESLGDKLFSVLRWSAFVFMGLSLGTPWILTSLSFDVTGHKPATEIPGPAYPLLAVWYLLMIVITSGWLIHCYRKTSLKLLHGAGLWVTLTFASGIVAAISYFLYEGHIIPWPVYPIFAAAVLISLFLSLWRQLHYELSEVQSLSVVIGSTSLMYPFIAGVLMTQGMWHQVAAGLLLIGSVPQVFDEIEQSIQVWIDQTIFQGRLSARQQVNLARQQAVRLSNLRDLVDSSVKHVIENLRVNSAALYFHDLTSNSFSCVSQHPNIVDDPISYSDGDRYVKGLKNPHELEHEEKEHFKDWESVIPLHQETGLFGFLLLGSREKSTTPYSAGILEEFREALEHPLTYAYVFYEQSMMLDKFTHDSIRYAGGIRMSLEVFLSEYGAQIPKEPKELYLDTIDQQATLLEEYLSDLRQIMSILSQRMQGRYKLEPYNVSEVVRKIWPSELIRAKHKQINLTSNVMSNSNPSDDIWGWGAQSSIRHVIENLLSNAFKFTPKGGSIRLDVNNLGDKIELVIIDSGDGIPPESLPHIFDLFYQGKGRESMEKSTGLGLSIVKEIVALHHGNIDVISEEGKGTSFFVRLPFAENKSIKAA